jgi:hypothetical protein
VAAAIVGVVFLALPSKTPPNPEPTGNEGAAQLSAKTTKHVTAADRRLIDETFDHFIPNALNRKNLDLAWAWAGPSLRAGATHAQWLHGTMPVPEFPAQTGAYHGWRVLDATPTTVDYSMLVHPRPGAHTSDWVFQGELTKAHGRWFVNTIYTTAILAKPHNGFNEVGPADFVAPGKSDSPPQSAAALGRTWLSTLIGVLVGVLVLVPLSLGAVILLRRRRWQKRVAAEGRNELPTLPTAARTAEERERDRTPVA